MKDVPNPLASARGGFLSDIGGVIDAGILGVDPQLMVTSWNPWLESATGRRAHDIVGRSLNDVEPHLRASARAAFQQALGGATVMLSQPLHGYLLDVKAPAGHENIIRMQQSVRILPLFAEDGSVKGAVALIQDVTERVARERELRAALEAAQAANQAKSDFLAAMSHELRTPIGAMSSYADLLAEGILGEVSEQQRQPLRRIKAVGAHLLEIVDEILAFARADAGREQIRVVRADVATVVEDAIVAVEPLIQRKGLQLERCMPEVPAFMQTDPVKVRQVIINLLGNAAKFTDTGSVSITLEINSDIRDNPTIEIRVTDTGIGIASEQMERVFEPFVRLDRPTGHLPEGAGLGLSVSRKLARLLGGDITVSSDVGKGTTFTLTLPQSGPAA